MFRVIKSKRERHIINEKGFGDYTGECYGGDDVLWGNSKC